MSLEIGNEVELKARYRGALLGLACADALGAPAEFVAPQDMRMSFPGGIREMIGGGMWEPGEWTDDTAMALCVADGILANPANPVRSIGVNFVKWAPTSKDVGTTCGAAIRGAAAMCGGKAGLLVSGNWYQASANTFAAKSGKAAGNGSLMRTLPVALAYWREPFSMVSKSAEISAMTHWDQQAEMCCAVYNLMAMRILNGHGLRTAWLEALDSAQSGLTRLLVDTTTMNAGTCDSNFWNRLENAPNLKYSDLQPSGYAGYVVECLEAAIWCVLNTTSYEECVTKAVNLGGEADTIAAVAGGLAGAFYGIEAIPARWLEKLHQSERLERTADALMEVEAKLLAGVAG